jgi:hypothetical protein
MAEIPPALPPGGLSYEQVRELWLRLLGIAQAMGHAGQRSDYAGVRAAAEEMLGAFEQHPMVAAGDLDYLDSMLMRPLERLAGQGQDGGLHDRALRFRDAVTRLQ